MHHAGPVLRAWDAIADAPAETTPADAACVAAGSVAYQRAESRSESEAAQAIEAAVQSLLLRDIFGLGAVGQHPVRNPPR